MADRNRNWNDQYNEDWNQDRKQRNQENEYRPAGNYGSSSTGRNDDDDDYQNRRRWSGEGRESRDRYSNTNNPYNSPYESRNRGYQQSPQQQHSGYSSQNWRNEDRDRNEGWGSAGMYGGDFGREDWERGNVNYGGNRYGQQQNRNWQDSNYGGYSPGFREQSSYRSDRERGDFDRRRGDDDRGWWDRTRDEVSSWFGDDDAERRRNRDKQYSEGGHRGKGPKDYQRSADRIREDVCDRLSDDDRLDATHIQVQVEGNEVILSGTVNDRYQKRYAEDLVESISGVRNVENRLKVGAGSLAAHNYTGNSEHLGGVGDESGTTNEIIRNVQNERNKNR